MFEDHYIKQRELLINQLKIKGIHDQKILNVMLKVERHKFIDKKLLDEPYSDIPQSIGYNQTISQPYIVALMTNFLNLSGEERVLEIGTGSGYQTAILCEMAKEVYSVERIKELHDQASETLKQCGYSNYNLKAGDGTLGWIEHAPYDAIIVTAKAPEIPKPLIEQLSSGGRLIIPVGKDSPQKLFRITKTKTGYNTEHVCNVYFVPLIGEYGFKSD